MDELNQQFPWIGKCVKKIDVTNVGTQHDLIELLKPMDKEIQINEALFLNEV